MTPSEIIQAIKTSPIKERQAERNICDFALNTAYSIHQSILNEMNDLRAEIDKTTNEHLLIAYSHKMKAYSGCFTIVSKEIETLEYYKEHGKYGDLL
jgi:hypothetical protein